jgi:hypothetical protein
MKTLTLFSVAALMIASFVGCTTVEKSPETTSTTTTESSTVRTPVAGASTTETHTVRSY